MDRAKKKATIQTIKILLICPTIILCIIGWLALIAGVAGLIGSVVGWVLLIGIFISGVWAGAYAEAKTFDDGP